MSNKIGRFEIRRELGRGAQSAVYLAWDPQLQREVAIKTLHFSHSDAGRNAMLLAEARAVSNLRHPNVVPIFDAGEQDGDPYLVFEYVEGKSLAEALHDDGAMSPAHAADIMRQVLDALAEAHAHGIIHRDLKPSNILLDARGTPRVMDFGIAARVENAVVAGEEGLSGTPAYMAPEYVTTQVVSERGDVFSAGLVLLEMITGRRYFQGETAQRVLYQVAYEPVELPRDVAIGEKMGDIILKACAADPAKRLSSVVQMREMLEAYLGSALQPTDSAETAESKKQSTLEFLLRRMRHKSDFPALSDSVSAINKLTDSDRESINKLSNTILRDYALTNKILRLVNSAYYRQAGGGNISTVSRAVVILGFNAIRNIAVTVLLFEHLQDKVNAKELKEAFLRVNLAGLLSRDAALRLIPRDAEEGFICALFHGLGQLLAQFYFPEEVDQIRMLMQQQKNLSEAAASTQVLGISFEELGIGIAETWGFPGAIINSMRHLPPGAVRKPTTTEGTLRVIAGFANEVCEMIASGSAADRGKAMKNLMARFGPSIETTEKQLEASMAKSMEDLAQVASILHVNLKQSPFARQALGFAGKPIAPSDAEKDSTTLVQTILGETAVLGASEAQGEGPATEDAHEIAQSVLAAGIQDIMNSLVEDFSLNDILRIILETMYRAMGFRRVLLCIKEAKTGLMTGRFGFGPDTAEVAKHFHFPVTYTADVFHLSISKGVDIIITDIDDPKIAERVPDWYRERISAKTFVLFPLNIKGNPVALIYCDNEKPGTIQIPEKELTLLKTLRNQAVLAIKQSM